MTHYSCLPAAHDKIAVIATWPGEDAESFSARVTSVSETGQAHRIARNLTKLSEAMWDAAAWLDIYDSAEAAVAELITTARDQERIETLQSFTLAGCRHQHSWTAGELTQLLPTELPATLSALSRAQRLSIADELEVDAQARTDSLALLPTGYDPEDASSRVWQSADITQVARYGLVGPLPDGAAGWIARAYDTTRTPAQRWGAREIIHRLEQLDAAAEPLGSRGGADYDYLYGPQVHLVLPSELFGVHIDNQTGAVTVSEVVDPAVANSLLSEHYRGFALNNPDRFDGDAIFNVHPDTEMRKVGAWDRDVFAKLAVVLRVSGQRVNLGSFAATDSGGFQKALGAWVSNATFRR